MSEKQSTYEVIIEHIFLSSYVEGDRQVRFQRQDIADAAGSLGLEVPPRNLGDVVYSFRYRKRPLPQSIIDKAPTGLSWVIMPDGIAKYVFVAMAFTDIKPNERLAETKIPDATPGVVARYSLSDEQALLARLRYNRLVDVFTGVACYSLQSHLRTTISNLGQIETDEVYVGVDKAGVHYVFPVQAKAGRDFISVVQIAQDFELCAARFPNLVARSIAAQFMDDELIAMFELERDGAEVRSATKSTTVSWITAILTKKTWRPTGRELGTVRCPNPRFSRPSRTNPAGLASR